MPTCLPRSSTPLTPPNPQEAVASLFPHGLSRAPPRCILLESPIVTNRLAREDRGGGWEGCSARKLGLAAPCLPGGLLMKLHTGPGF